MELSLGGGVMFIMFVGKFFRWVIWEVEVGKFFKWMGDKEVEV